MRDLPVGISDFKTLRDENYYFVDKSLFIDSVMSVGKVFLFTRPRRFGKTLNMSMLDTYLNVRYADDPDRFEGLCISDIRPNDPEKNSNLVVTMSFRALGEEPAEFMDRLRDVASELYAGFPELSGSDRLDEARRRQFDRIVSREATESDLRSCLRDLTEMLFIHHGKKPVVLIDDFDAQVNGSSMGDGSDSAAGVVERLLQSAFKDNDSLKFGVVTGVMRVIPESIFSGLDNFVTGDIFDEWQSGMFGFTPEEVKSACLDLGRPDRSEEAVEWCGGYRFGDSEVCNPLYFMEFAANGFEQRDLSGEGYDALIDRMADSGMFAELAGLAGGGSMRARINRFVMMGDIGSDVDNLVSAMVMAGYLKAVPVRGLDECTVSSPNFEARHLFSGEFLDTIVRKTREFDKAEVYLVSK